MTTKTDRTPGVQQGIQESRQDKKQDDTAKQRPGLKDAQIHDDHSKRPKPSKQRGD